LLTGSVSYYILETTGELNNAPAATTVQKTNTHTSPSATSKDLAVAKPNADIGENDFYSEGIPSGSVEQNDEAGAPVIDMFNPRGPKRRAQTRASNDPSGTELQNEVAANDVAIPNTTIEAVDEKVFVPQTIDSDPVLNETESAVVPKETKEETVSTIESVTNAYQLLPKNAKLAFQVFVTPTVSYRNLSENKGYHPPSPNGSAANYPEMYSIDDAVTHKPDMGLELGMTAKYTVDNKLKLRGGVQFNMSRYDIKAFTYTSELATIALSRNGSSGVDYVDQVSSYRNFSGNRANWLQNTYFQVSAPMGIELKLAGNDRANFGFASTLQPSYMLGERAYMLSSDYKNYTRVPQLVRRWNVATNLETFVSYSTGQVKWQVGPQIRYQLLSSFVSTYPVKEHLFDFGMKVGVSLNGKKIQSDTR
jgi:hypothetical protein